MIREAGATKWVPPRSGGLRGLRAALPTCRGCELWEDAEQVVPGAGPARARLVIVGEQPGDQEDLAGEPFVGPAGALLRTVMHEVGLDPEESYLTNAVKHFRHEGTRGKQRLHKTPARRHVTACGPWLVSELEVVRPTGTVLLGATAAQAVYGRDFKVTEQRGQLLEWPQGSGRTHPEWGLVTVHPSAVLRSRDRARDREAFANDLSVAAAALS